MKDVESAVRLLLSVSDSEFVSAAPPGGTKEAGRRVRDVRQGGFLRTNLFLFSSEEEEEEEEG